MDKVSIEGVVLTELKMINHPKGDIYHAMKKSDNGYAGFGEAYFSTVNQNAIKGWKKHTQMLSNLKLKHQYHLLLQLHILFGRAVQNSSQIVALLLLKYTVHLPLFDQVNLKCFLVVEHTAEKNQHTKL